MTKICGNGQASILTEKQLKALFTEGFTSPRDKALFGICLYTACRISEALSLHTSDVKSQIILFRKRNTKGKLATREVIITPPLANFLNDYKSQSQWMFPGQKGLRERLHRGTADQILRKACQRINIDDGVSTHSFRRTALTMMSRSGIPLRTIQKISGHNDLAQLQKYLEVSQEELAAAALTIHF